MRWVCCACLAPVGDLLDLAAHLEDVVLRLDDVGASHQEERIRGLYFFHFFVRVWVVGVWEERGDRKKSVVRDG